jgi:hypothetical protein
VEVSSKKAMLIYFTFLVGSFDDEVDEDYYNALIARVDDTITESQELQKNEGGVRFYA